MGSPGEGRQRPNMQFLLCHRCSLMRPWLTQQKPEAGWPFRVVPNWHRNWASSSPWQSVLGCGGPQRRGATLDEGALGCWGLAAENCHSLPPAGAIDLSGLRGTREHSTANPTNAAHSPMLTESLALLHPCSCKHLSEGIIPERLADFSLLP